MKWEHRCSLDWLRERQQHLTASDVRALVPVTRTGRSRDVGDQEYIKVAASKMVELTEEDCLSFGAAARGHMLEPFAVDALNEILTEAQGPEHETFFWWDDKVLGDGTLAFSPDALDVPMGSKDRPTAIAEIKSYSAERHLHTAYLPKELIEERWQIATAMASCESIDHGYLVLFNPSMKSRRLFVITFDRDELREEIEAVLKVRDRWVDFWESGPLSRHMPNDGIWMKTSQDERSIIEEISESQRLNPV